MPDRRRPDHAAVARGEGVAHRGVRSVEHHRRRAVGDPADPGHRRAERRPWLGSAGCRRRDRGVPALRLGARCHLGPDDRRGGRVRDRAGGPHEVLPLPAGADDQPPPVAAGWAELRVLLGGSSAVRQDRRCVRAGRPVPGGGGHREALRGQRRRVRAQHDELGRGRALAARALPATVRAGGHRGRGPRRHDRVQPAERHVLHRGRRAAHHHPPRGMGVRRHRHDRLVRVRRHRGLRRRGARPRDARSGPGVRGGAGRSRARGTGARGAARCDRPPLAERHRPAGGVG